MIGSIASYHNEIIAACREERNFTRFANDFICSGEEEVITVAGSFYNLPVNSLVFITGFNYGLVSVSDECHFEMVLCTAVDGGGDATAMIGHYHVKTGAAVTGRIMFTDTFSVPKMARYSDGVRSVALRVNANDGSAIIEGSFSGWHELE